MKLSNREQGFDQFMEWLHSEGVDTEAVSIDKFDKEGYGLKANRLISVGHTNNL